MARWTVQAVAVMLWLGPIMGRRLLATRHPGVQLARGAMLVVSSLLFLTALRFLPLADATALNYSTPTLVVIAAVVFLHERMTRARAAFVLAGIVGMVMIVRPGADLFRGASLLVIGGASLYAAFQILTRKLAHEDSRVLLFYPSLVGSLLLTCVLPTVSLPAHVPWGDMALLLFGALLGTTGHFLFILAFQRAPASAVTPFTYMQLVWATLVGWLAFGDFPDALTMLGMAVIAGSGLLLAWYERRVSIAQTTIQAPTAID
jgi:drug/metabolite transporter (DMT)-like permease